MTLDSIFIGGNPESWDELKKRYRQKLTVTLYRPLNLDNIENFADTALSEVIDLTSEITKKYKEDKDIPNNTTISREQEDSAFKYYELINMEEVLESISEVKAEIDQIKTYIKSNIPLTSEVVIPPQSNTENNFGIHDGTLDKRKIFPRLLTLLYVLKHDFSITPEQVTITSSTTEKVMLRKEPYVRLNIPNIDRLVYICDEEGNASYIFDTNKLTEYGLNLLDIDHSDKGDLNNLLTTHKGLGKRLIQTSNWREQMKDCLENDFSENNQAHTDVETEISIQPKTEFISKSEKAGLSFEDFQEQVKTQWLINGQQTEGGIKKWYKQEYKRKNIQGKRLHPGWQINSEDKYKKQGKWKSWPELLGLEPERRKTFEVIADYSDFEKQVREQWAINGSGGKSQWYLDEYKKVDTNGDSLHPGWPAMPYNEYKNRGWKSWPKLMGEKHDRFREYFEAFEEFQRQVKEQWLTNGKGNIDNIDEWYKAESEKEDSEGNYVHPGWPVSPRGKYAKDGWHGWHKLLGIEGVKREVFESPIYDEFEKQVRGQWAVSGDPKKSVVDWYRKECMRKGEDGEFIHKNWPYDPYTEYKNKGWKTWPGMVGLSEK